MSAHLLAAAVVPGAPMVLSAASPAQPADVAAQVQALRRDVIAAVEALPRTDAVLLVAAGPRGVHDHAVADLTPLGIAARPVELPVAVELIEDLTRLTQYPRFRGEPLSVELTTLVRVVERVLGEVPVVPVSVPPTARPDVLRAVGASLHEALEDVEATATLVAAGDLSAGLDETSPGYLLDGARSWDASVVSAFEQGDLGALDRYGPGPAVDVRARGWPALVVAAGAAAAARLRPVEVRYHAPRGVGGLVARFLDRSEAPTGRYEIPGGRTGVLEKPEALDW